MEKLHIYIDIRRPEEYAVGHIPGCRNVDFEEDVDTFVNAVRELVETHDVTLYCHSSFRSAYAQSLLLAKHGIVVQNMEGGLALYQGPLEYV